jgi:rare lipoprotein A (peptidoglycan hydrolase)
MKFKLFLILQTVFLAIICMFVMPSLRPADKPAAMSADAAQPSGTLAVALPAKPLKVWDCISSWYGADFDGLPTANGETYDMNAATAAHPTLPMGSVVRVINLRNHRSAIVRINDRGPYVEGRDLDVSYAVARRLGFAQRGLSRVRIELLELP